MSKIVAHNLKCLSPTCQSSDGRQLYDTGTSFCFSCTTWFSAADSKAEEIVESTPKSPSLIRVTTDPLEIKENFQVRSFPERKISKEVCEFYGVKVGFKGNGEIGYHYYPYKDGESYQRRELPKTFTWINKVDDLFGIERFQMGGKRVIICEGAMDTLSMAEASYRRYKKFYPIIGLPSAAYTKSLIAARDQLRNFDEIIVCFDEDEAGHKAQQEAVKILGLDKVKLTKLPKKDAGDVLTELGPEELLRCTFDAVKYIPSGIITKEALWEQMANYDQTPSTSYPPCLEGLNTKLKGMRLNEITLFTSGTGSGKSTMLREIILHILSTEPDAKIGVVSLEESPAETGKKISAMYLSRNPSQEEIPLDELRHGFDATFGTDRIILLDHQGSMSDTSIMDKLEYMCLMGCQYLLLDHITILVSEGVEGREGNEAQDKIMSDLLKLVKRHPVWLGLVSHLRKTSNSSGKSFEEGRLPSMDDIKGSGSIKQIAFDIVGFARNMNAESEMERNTIDMCVLKCRFSGLTGAVPGARYIYSTGRLEAISHCEEFVTI